MHDFVILSLRNKHEIRLNKHCLFPQDYAQCKHQEITFTEFQVYWTKTKLVQMRHTGDSEIDLSKREQEGILPLSLHHATRVQCLMQFKDWSCCPNQKFLDCDDVSNLNSNVGIGDGFLPSQSLNFKRCQTLAEWGKKDHSQRAGRSYSLTCSQQFRDCQMVLSETTHRPAM